MKTSIRLAAAALASTVILGACGGGSAEEAVDPAADASAPQTTVQIAERDLGPILVDGDGLTLYAFTDDVDGESTCYDACATAWPPVPGEARAGDGVDESLIRTIQREDGSTQLAMGDWPLYRFSGDAAPGDTNGQGSGDVWFVVNQTGALVVGTATADAAPGPETPEAPAAPTGAELAGAPVLTGADGFTLYVFANDTQGASNCEAPCSDTWPPVFADETISIDPLRLDVIQRNDGSSQLAIDGLPLYRYIGDAAPGDVTGHEVGGVWFAVGADGEVIRPAGVRVGSTDIGDALIDPDGFTLYTFGNDTANVSTCNDPCSATWPPVPGETKIDGSVLEPGQFGSITRDDGSQQLTLDGRPLYRYVGDEFPGDANGIAVGGGIWKGVAADSLTVSENPSGAVVSVSVTAQPAAGISIADTDLGPTLVDGAGMTLYGLLDDTRDSSNCEGACADAWPPVPGDTAIPADADPDLFGVIERSDGSTQLAAGDWPLYRFSGDVAPGDTNGQGSGGVWFVASPEGWLYR